MWKTYTDHAAARVLPPVVTGLNRTTLNGPAMGARWSATFFHDDSVDLEALRARLAGAVEQVEVEMSSWRPSSDLNRLNGAPVGSWIDLPAGLAQVIDAGLAVSRLSGGAFDIGVGDLVKAWGFGGGARTPDGARINALAGTPADGALKTLELDLPARRARKHAALRLDLGGIAKGFGVDELGRVLDEAGLTSWLVGIDGEMRARGLKADGRPWMVGHERPDPASRSLMGVLELTDAAIATSGSYRHVVEISGRKFSHTMDPRGGKPLTNDIASVTVLAPSCMIADAWATALMVLGREAGADKARALGLAAIFVFADGSSLEVGLEDGDRAKGRASAP